MPNYQNGKVYAIRSYQTDDIYIGSTTQGLAERMGGHRAMYRLYQNGKGNYFTSFKILEYIDAYIELLELYPCACKAELEKREGELIREHHNTVNKCIPGRTDKQYYQDNREKFSERKKKYYQDNREKCLEYYQDNREKYLEYGKQYRKDNHEKISGQKKKYYQDNREKRLEQLKQYRQANRERINEKKKQKFNCPCGGNYTRSHKSQHMKSKKHQKYITTCNRMKQELTEMKAQNDELERIGKELDTKARKHGLI